MTYKCPRCGSQVQKGSSRGAQFAGGLMGMLFYSAFSSFKCDTCGRIPRSEFPPRVQGRMLLGTVLVLIPALALFLVLLAILFGR